MTILYNELDKTVTISREVYRELKDDQNFLRALMDYGVDNWSGYDGAVEIYQEENSKFGDILKDIPKA